MTTVAWDGKTLAVDSRGTDGDRFSGDDLQKMFFNVGEFLAVAFAGPSVHYPRMIEWLACGAKREDFPNDMACGLFAINKDGECIHYNGNEPYPLVIKAGEAIGSGRYYAEGAMAAGIDACGAVRAASKLNLHTGGPIHFYVAENQSSLSGYTHEPTGGALHG